MENTTTENIIVSWVGTEDIRAVRAFCARNGIDGAQDVKSCTVLDGEGTNGPVRALTDWLGASRIFLLAACDTVHDADRMRAWVERGSKASCTVVETGVADPFSHEEVWQATEAFFSRNWNADAASSFNFHLTAGTPAMQAALFYASQVRYAGGHAWRVVDPTLAAPDGTRCFEVRLPFRLPAELWSAPCDICLADAALSSEILKIYAPVRAISILVMGEDGVGKTAFARKIHAACAGHKNNFAEVHCATLAAGTFADFAAALFGRQGENGPCPGAFEKARGGTLYLNGIEHLPAEWQAVLARALAEKEYEVPGGCKRRVDNVRVVTSASRDLAQDAGAGLFRQDLYAAIAMCPVRLPALRDVVATDSGRLAGIVREILASLGREASEFARDWQLAPEAMDRLRACSWPGNVRELRQVLLLSCVRALARASHVITGQDIERHLGMVHPAATMTAPSPIVREPEPVQVPVAPATPVAPVAPVAEITQPVVEEPQKAEERQPAEAAPVQPVAETPAAPARPASPEDADDFLPSNLEQWLADKRMEFINKALAMCDGSKAKAGKLLGLTYQQMLYFEKRAGQPVTGRRGRRRKNAEETPAEEAGIATEIASEIVSEDLSSGESDTARVAAEAQGEETSAVTETAAEPAEVPEAANVEPAEQATTTAPEPAQEPVQETAEPVVVEQALPVEAAGEATAPESTPAAEGATEPTIDEIANHIVAQMLKPNNGKDGE